MSQIALPDSYLKCCPHRMMIDDLLLVHIASLEAALAKLDIKIPIKDLLKAIHDEDEAKLGVLN